MDGWMGGWMDGWTEPDRRMRIPVVFLVCFRLLIVVQIVSGCFDAISVIQLYA